jgi:hypothetical protein
MCIDYLELNKATQKDHFPLPFIDEMLEWLANHSFFYYLNGYSGYHQIPIHLHMSIWHFGIQVNVIWTV